MEAQDWDYVILQEQSVIPSIQDERDQRIYPAVRALDEKNRHALDSHTATVVAVARVVNRRREWRAAA